MSSLSLSNVPLLSHQDAEQADVSIIALANAVGAAKAGKLPTTDQVVNGVRKLLSSSLLQPEIGSVLAGKAGGGKLSKRGKDVVLKSRKVLESLARLVLEKNNEDQIQKFIWQASQADVDIDVDADINVGAFPSFLPRHFPPSSFSSSLPPPLSLFPFIQLRVLLPSSPY
jgi:hypothetical protein